jgi:hypothetical protein
MASRKERYKKIVLDPGAVHHDASPTPNLDSAGTREQPALGPSLSGTENKGLNPSNSGDFSPIWTALAEAKDTLNAIGAAPEPGSPYEPLA